VSQHPPFIYLSEEALSELHVTTAEAVEGIEHMIRGLARSEVWTTPKSGFIVPDGRYMMSTLAAADDPPVLAVKSLVLNPRNPEHGLPQINGTVTLLDSRTGLPLAVVDGNWVTAVRTAALSAVAAKRMARPDSSVAAFIGCGIQANSHLKAFSDLYPLAEVRAFGRGSANRDALCATAERMGFTTVASASGQEAIEGADLIVTSVTLSMDSQPFLDAAGLKPGAFAAVTDFAAPWIAASMPALDRIIVDDIEQESSTPYPMVDPKLIRGDLKGLINGETPGRESDQEINAFIFRGLSIGDLALADVAHRKAREASAGSAIR